MTMKWRNGWAHSRTNATLSGHRPSAFADPLESEDWNGLGWSIPLIARLVGGQPESKNCQKIKEVQRFTVPAGANSVCVS